MSLRLDGLLDPAAQARLDHHLDSCTACQAQWAALQTADRSLRLAARRPLAPPSDFTARVMSRVAATPAVRPSFWERTAVQGGRPTIPLQEGPVIVGRPVPLPLAPAPSSLTSLWDQFRAVYSRRMGFYLGGVSLAGVFSLLVLVMTGILWTAGTAPVPSGVQSALSLSGQGEAAQTWAVAGWTVLSDLATGIGPWLVGAAALVITGLSATWWRIVAALVRRARPEVEV
jgi:anti-sigma factor RsiW